MNYLLVVYPEIWEKTEADWVSESDILSEFGVNV